MLVPVTCCSSPSLRSLLSRSLTALGDITASSGSFQFRPAQFLFPTFPHGVFMLFGLHQCRSKPALRQQPPSLPANLKLAGPDVSAPLAQAFSFLPTLAHGLKLPHLSRVTGLALDSSVYASPAIPREFPASSLSLCARLPLCSQPPSGASCLISLRLLLDASKPP